MSEAPSPSREASMETQENESREEPAEADRVGQRIVLPEDGYEWRKYGQKYIKNIGKYRSYFKCHWENCNAKKRAEWTSTEPDNIRVVYYGVHTHALVDPSAATAGGGSSNANQYNLLTQLLGNPTPPSSQSQSQNN